MRDQPQTGEVTKGHSREDWISVISRERARRPRQEGTEGPCAGSAVPGRLGWGRT